MSLSLTTACSGDEENMPPVPDSLARRTVLLYVVAQNNLSQALLSDSLELWRGRGYVDTRDRLLVFVDGGGPAQIYRVEAGTARPQTVRRMGDDVASTDPAVLRDVLTWVRTNYPAHEYGLVMCSHADGWLPATNTQYINTRASAVAPRSFGIDNGRPGDGPQDGPQMDVDAMADAVAASGMRMKYIFFDACLMQGLEVAYALRDVTDYVIGGPVSVPGSGANYTHLLERGLFSTTPWVDIITTYRDDVADPQQAAQYDDFGIVLSTLRTEALPALAEALRRVLPASQLAGHNSPDMSGVTAYQYYGAKYYYRPHAYDARQALRRILPETEREAVLSALDRAIVARATTSRFWCGPGYWDYVNVTDDCCGVSAFIPQALYSQNAAGRHGDLNASFRHTDWYTAAGWSVTGW